MSEGSPQNDTSPNESSQGKPGEYVVVARRYRPQTFDQLVGQQQVSQALQNAIERGRVGHAYLFTGARGVGKTSSARILAKALNCIHGPTPSPCNECDICLSVTSGEDVDVLEIDGASNRGIEEIRQLRSNINIRPSRARFKVYIIDEVHMFTREAFNALLKTLEEPPEHVKFIFCTTDPEKIPITVLSRCQRFDFGGIQPDAISERLAHIVEAEGVSATPDALQLLARRANGSMRDSQSLLEQLLAFGEKNITVDDVHRMLGTAGLEQLQYLTAALLQRDAATALGCLGQAISSGVDAGQLIEQLLGYFRDMMTTNVGCSADVMQVVPAADFEQLQDAAKQYGLPTIMAAIQILDDTLIRMQRTTHATILSEMAVVRLCRLDDLQLIGDMVEAIRSGEPLPARPIGAPISPRPPQPGPEPGQPSVSANLSQSKISQIAPITTVVDRPLGSTGSNPLPSEDVQHRPVVKELSEETPPNPSNSNTLELTSANCREIWDSILADMTDTIGTSAASYHDVAITAPNRLVVSYSKSYTVKRLEDNRKRFEVLLAQACGGRVDLDFVVVDKPAQSELKEATSSQPTQGQLIRQVQASPLVQEAMELFGAEVAAVRPPNPIPPKSD
ncbi:MAG: DNA polymerase III subunit gamma/tau [Pirellulales bacterium]